MLSTYQSNIDTSIHTLTSPWGIPSLMGSWSPLTAEEVRPGGRVTLGWEPGGAALVTLTTLCGAGSCGVVECACWTCAIHRYTEGKDREGGQGDGLRGGRQKGDRQRSDRQTDKGCIKYTDRGKIR